MQKEKEKNNANIMKEGQMKKEKKAKKESGSKKIGSVK